MRLILRLLAGILAGILLGLFSPDWPLRLLLTFKALFGQFIGFSIPLIILFFIMSGIASLGRNGDPVAGNARLPRSRPGPDDRALYMDQDSFGTACNVTGDGPLSLIVDKLARDALPDPDKNPHDAGVIERPC